MILTPMVIADTPACTTKDRGVTMLRAGTPVYPPSARDIALGTVYVYIRVVVNADGNLTSATIAQSGHNAAIDYAALQAVRGSTFAPMIADCAGVIGTTLFEVTMDPQTSAIAAGGPSTALPCNVPNVEAAITNAVSPRVPAHRLTNAATVVVRVSVYATGGVGPMQIVRSSGDEFVDLAVLKAAHDSQYAPRYVDCKPAPGVYLFTTDIMP